MPTEHAVPEYSAQHDGRAVYFCCHKCVRRFTQDPAPYLGHLARASEGPGGPAAMPVAVPVVPPPPGPLSQLATDARPLLYVGLAAFVAHLVAARVVGGRVGESAAARAARRLSVPLARRSTLLALLLSALAAGVVRLGLGLQGAREAAAAVEKRLVTDLNRFQTASRFAGELTRQGLEQGPLITGALDATYYRGNDERNAGLFNNGKYRTCTFRVSLEDAAGAPVRPGADVSGKDLFVKLEMRRAPFTGDDFFSALRMRRVRLFARAAEPLMGPMKTADAAVDASAAEGMGLTTVEPDWAWEVRYPVGRFAVTEGVGELSGVIVLCPDIPAAPPNGTEWTRANYGIPYHLRAEDGRLAASSRLWMASLYFSTVKTDADRAAWFSHLPIPELPVPNTTDKKLLGSDKLRTPADLVDVPPG